MTDRRMDGQTEGRTDIVIANAALYVAWQKDSKKLKFHETEGT